MVADGLMPAFTAAQMLRWLEIVVPMLEAADLADALPPELTAEGDGWVLPEDFFAEHRGRYGHHTEDFTVDVWPEMTELHRAHPGAVW